MVTDVNRIKYLIEKLRSITLAVQITPFVYTALYIAILFTYPFAKDSVLNILDTLFYVSPLVVVILLRYSRILKLCVWHRTACCLPLVPQVAVLVDYHIAQFSRTAVWIHYATMLLMTALLLVAAYNVFLKPKHNERIRPKERVA